MINGGGVWTLLRILMTKQLWWPGGGTVCALGIPKYKTDLPGEGRHV